MSYRRRIQLVRMAAIPVALYVAIAAIVYFRQRSMLFFPTHAAVPSAMLTSWWEGKRTIGYCREVPNPDTIWLMMHGNAGQAADRDYVLRHLSDRDSLYVLEYPGYGLREGGPSLKSMNQAASEAYKFCDRNTKTFPSACWQNRSAAARPALWPGRK